MPPSNRKGLARRLAEAVAKYGGTLSYLVSDPKQPHALDAVAEILLDAGLADLIAAKESAEREAVEARDREWCKMLGYEESFGPGDRPDYIRRELDHQEREARRAAYRKAAEVAREHAPPHRKWVGDEIALAIEALADAEEKEG